jgi:cytochrome c-type biogenesis protein CcmF
MAWKRGDALGALMRLKAAFIAAAVIGLATVYVVSGGPVMAVLGVALAVWILVGTALEFLERIKLSWTRARKLPRSAWGTTIAHAGVGLFVLGVSASAWQVERVEAVKPGDTIEIAGWTLRYEGVEEGQGANYAFQRGTVTVLKGSDRVATMHPERRFYPVARQGTTEAAIRTNGFGDLYIALGDPDGKGAMVLRAWWNPLVPWIWFGAIVMALGGVVSLSDRRFRVGAPARRRAAAAAATA